MDKNNIANKAKEVLRLEADALNFGAKNIDDNFTNAVLTILNCKGKVVVMGLGKSGLVGAKIAATLSSTGTPSFFLHPTEGLHGDLGMLGKDDCIIAISSSGETAELMQALPHIQGFGLAIIALTGNKTSSIARMSDLVINIEVEKEACPLNSAPTSSTTLTMAIGDALAITLMYLRDFQHGDFAKFHPGGTLGKRLFIKAYDLAKKENIPTISQNASLKNALLVMSEGRLGTVILTADNGDMTGMLSDGDVRRALQGDNFSVEKSAIEYANKKPFTTDKVNLLAYDALRLIEERKIQMLIFCKGNKAIGVLHIHSLIEAGI